MSSIERAMKARRGQDGEATSREAPVQEGAEPPETAREVAASPEETPAPSGDSRPPRDTDYDGGGHVELDMPLLAQQGFLDPNEPDRRLQEEYRMAKRPVLAHAFTYAVQGTPPGNLIQVTSSQDGEGKTFSVFNLGMSIAMELDYTVLLIDGDLTRRQLTRLACLANRPGLTDVLESDGGGLSEAIVNTNVPHFRILPAGTAHPRSTELIASGHMKALTEELAARYPDRVIIFDSTPLLGDSQAATLATHMGQVLVVVEAGRTSEGQVKESCNLLEHSAARTGFLLNKSPQGYGSGYYYGKY
ncbi:hypothetical protein [Thiohalorhabdus sp.]|uniref:hypothetical protein n=1 Tax=Thiohalorhabdus sp. TaxID=3094134 RepID=UPI002FC327EC